VLKLEAFFVIEPMQTVIERIELEASDKVAGNLSVSNGLVDFSITNPCGDVLLTCNKTEFTSFIFTARQNGNYTFYPLNVVDETVTATLYYGLEQTVVKRRNWRQFNIGAGVESPNPLPPIPDPDIDLENLYERYLSFLKAQEILQTVRSVWKYMLLQNALFVLACSIAAFGL
jgi:hypothetical protein